MAGSRRASALDEGRRAREKRFAGLTRPPTMQNAPSGSTGRHMGDAGVFSRR
ncbi:hypothetical protein COLINT_02760 [Collinsella intestinalis DSM 13280]|uniref:Uncharacterized protein n=1 Tax=Collinsella intestinalis DSM 13280 TaxID=521003 RepID=C4F9M6_9ACTN|nr:hypothetical protein COLINT_02760 [Collinsella intestinalis DSM 13280]